MLNMVYFIFTDYTHTYKPCDPHEAESRQNGLVISTSLSSVSPTIDDKGNSASHLKIIINTQTCIYVFLRAVGFGTSCELSQSYGHESHEMSSPFF